MAASARVTCVWRGSGRGPQSGTVPLWGGNPLFRTNGEPEKGGKKIPNSLLTHQISLVNYRICLPYTRLIPFFWPDFCGL